MILTVTLNPAVDIRYTVEPFQINTINRVTEISKTAGGKGLNVSRVLRQLGEDVMATGFLGGSLGDFIITEVAKEEIHQQFVSIEGETRNCIAIVHGEQQTEILESGPVITFDEARLFLERFEELLNKVELVTISGSLPMGVEDTFYNRLLESAHMKKKPVLLDTKGDLLGKALTSRYKPYLIKPNKDEIEDLVDWKIDTTVDMIRILKEEPLLKEVPWVVVTLGREGAIVKNRDRLFRVQIPKVNAVNPVGSGDSVMAGFASGIHRNLDVVDLIKYGITMGVLNALEEKTGYINPEKVEQVVGRIGVEEV